MSNVLFVYALHSSLKLLSYSPEFGMCIRHPHGMFLLCPPTTTTKAVGWLIDWLIDFSMIFMSWSYVLCQNIYFFHLLVLFTDLSILPQSLSLTNMKCSLVCKRELDETSLYWPRHILENADPMKYLRKVKWMRERKERGGKFTYHWILRTHSNLRFKSYPCIHTKRFCNKETFNFG